MFFRCRCIQRMLSHHIAYHLKRRNKGPSRRYKYGNYAINKYLVTAEQLGIRVTPLGGGLYELSNGHTTRRLMSNLCMDKENVVTYKICGSKYLTYELLLHAGIRHIPKHQLYTFRDIDRTCKDFQNWNCPVVIKPCSGTSGGNGVTVNIKSIKELRNAICESFVFDREAFLMEQFIEGAHYRVVTLKGEFLVCCHRTPARIIGNGRDSVETLIQNENERRSRDESEKALWPILVDNEVRRKLQSMDKSMATVLKADEELYVRDAINFHAGGELRRVECVSEDIKSTCRRIAEVLDIYLAGFDIITPDIGRPFAETNGVINEVNTSPGLQNMFTLREDGTEVHIAEIVLCDMFALRPCHARVSGKSAATAVPRTVVTPRRT